MRLTLFFHVLAGSAGLVLGYVALFAAKGAAVHRRSGLLFVSTMVVMAIGGAVLALGLNKAPAINIPAALLTTYLMITALTTVRPLPIGSRPTRWLALGGMLVALVVGAIMIVFAVEAVTNGGKRNGMPAFPCLLFASIGLTGAAGDIRVLRNGAFAGPARLARHLWRMSMALFLAALSFSVQAARILSKYVDVPGFLIAVPMLLVLGTMAYWLWRVRLRRSLRGMVLLPAAMPGAKGAAQSA
jgi:uncharacterized membrane protein